MRRAALFFSMRRPGSRSKREKMKRTLSKKNLIFIIIAAALAVTALRGFFSPPRQAGETASAYSALPGYGTAPYLDPGDTIDFTAFEALYTNASTGAVSISQPYAKTILISSAEDLYSLSYRINGRPKGGNYNTAITATRDFYRAAKYKLANNIEYGALSSDEIPKGLLAMGTESSPFTGIFDGQGFEIRNLFYMDDSSYIVSGDSLAPFGANAGTVMNLGVVYGNINITGMSLAVSSKNFAGIAGNNMANGTISHCFAVASSVTAANIYGITARNHGAVNNVYFAVTSTPAVNYIVSAGAKQPVADNNTNVTSAYYVDSHFPAGVVSGTAQTDSALKSATALTDADTIGPRWYPHSSAALAGGYPRLSGTRQLPGASGTDPYVLMRPADIIALPELMNAVSAYRSRSYKLTNDINMSTVAENAYRMPEAIFTGSLDGTATAAKTNGSFAIINLRLVNIYTYSSSEIHCAMFMCGGGASITNINFVGGYARLPALTKNSELLTKSTYISICVSRLAGNTLTMTNVHSSAAVSADSEALGRNIYMGGLIGYAGYSAELSDCSVSGNVDGGTHNTYTNQVDANSAVGGIAGYMNSYGNRLSNVTYFGSVTGIRYIRREITAGSSTSLSCHVGGIAGYFSTSSSSAVSGAVLAAGAEVNTLPKAAANYSFPAAEALSYVNVRAGGIFGINTTTTSNTFVSGALASYGTVNIVEYSGLYNGAQLPRTIYAGGLIGENSSGTASFSNISRNGKVTIYNPSKTRCDTALFIGGFVGYGYFSAANCAPYAGNDLIIDSYAYQNIFIGGIAYNGGFTNCNVTTSIYFNTQTDVNNNFAGCEVSIGGYSSRYAIDNYSYIYCYSASSVNTGNIYIGKAGAASINTGRIRVSSMFNYTYSATDCENKGKIIFNTDFTPSTGVEMYLSGIAYYAANALRCKNNDGEFLLKKVTPLSGKAQVNFAGLFYTAVDISDCINNTKLELNYEVTADLYINGIACLGTGAMVNCTFGGTIDVNATVRTGVICIAGLAYSRTTLTNCVNNADINVNASNAGGGNVTIAGLCSFSGGTLSGNTNNGKIYLGAACAGGNLYAAGLVAGSITTMSGPLNGGVANRNNGIVDIAYPFTGSSVYVYGLSTGTVSYLYGGISSAAVNIRAQLTCTANLYASAYVYSVSYGYGVSISGTLNIDSPVSCSSAYISGSGHTLFQSEACTVAGTLNINQSITATNIYLSGGAYSITYAYNTNVGGTITLGASAVSTSMHISGISFTGSSGARYEHSNYTGTVWLNAPYSTYGSTAYLYINGVTSGGTSVSVMLEDCRNQGTFNITQRFSAAAARTFYYSGVARFGHTLTRCVNEGTLVMPDNVFNGNTNASVIYYSGIVDNVYYAYKCFNSKNITIVDNSTATVECAGIARQMGSSTGEIWDSANGGDISIRGSFGSVSAAGICTRSIQGRVSNCFNGGNITLGASGNNASTTGAVYLAGIGNNPITGLRLDNCFNFGNISEYNTSGGAIHVVAGICGYSSVASTSFENCVNLGNIYTNNATSSSINYYASAGGIIGCAYTAVTAINIVNCVNYGNIESGCAAGGIAGFLRSGVAVIKNVVNHGAVASPASGSAFAGGIAGYCYTSISADSTMSFAVNYGLVTGVTAYSGGIFGSTGTGATGGFTGAGNVSNILYVHQAGSSPRMAGTSPITPVKTTTAMTNNVVSANVTTNNVNFAGIIMAPNSMAAANGGVSCGIYNKEFFLRANSDFTQELVYSPYANVYGSWYSWSNPVYVRETVTLDQGLPTERPYTYYHLYAVCNSIGRDYALYLTENMYPNAVEANLTDATFHSNMWTAVWNARQILYPEECEVAEAPLRVKVGDGGVITDVPNVPATITSEEGNDTIGYIEYYVNSEVISANAKYIFVFDPNTTPPTMILSKGAKIQFGSLPYVEVVFDYTQGRPPFLRPTDPEYNESDYVRNAVFTVYQTDDGGETIAQKTWEIKITYTPTDRALSLTDIYINGQAIAASPVPLVEGTDYTETPGLNTTVYQVNSYFDETALREVNMLLISDYTSTTGRLRIDFNTVAFLDGDSFRSNVRLFRYNDLGAWVTAPFTFTLDSGSLITNGYVYGAVNDQGRITGELSISIDLALISASVPSGIYKLEIIYQDQNGVNKAIEIIINRGKNTARTISYVYIPIITTALSQQTLATTGNLNPTGTLSYGQYVDFSRLSNITGMSVTIPTASYGATVSAPRSLDITENGYAHIYTIVYRSYSEFDAGYAILKDRAGYFNEYTVTFTESQPVTPIYTFTFNNVPQSDFTRLFEIDKRATNGANMAVQYLATGDYGYYYYDGAVWGGTANTKTGGTVSTGAKSVLHRIDYKVQLTYAGVTQNVAYNPTSVIAAVGTPESQLVNIWARNGTTGQRVEQGISFGAEALSGTYKITQVARAIEPFAAAASYGAGIATTLNGVTVPNADFKLGWREYEFQSLNFEKQIHRECYATSLGFDLNPSAVEFVSPGGSKSDAIRLSNGNLSYNSAVNMVDGVDIGSRAGNVVNVLNNTNRVKTFTVTAAYEYDDEVSFANRAFFGIPLFATLWMWDADAAAWIQIYDADPDTGAAIEINPFRILYEGMATTFEVRAESLETTRYILTLGSAPANKAIEVRLKVSNGYTGYLFVTLYTVLMSGTGSSATYKVTRQTNIIWGSSDYKEGDEYTYFLVAHIAAYYVIDVQCAPGYGITGVTSKYLGSARPDPLPESVSDGRYYINLNFGGEDSDLVTISVGSTGAVPWGLHDEIPV